jgi:hypothetical protein
MLSVELQVINSADNHYSGDDYRNNETVGEIKRHRYGNTKE